MTTTEAFLQRRVKRRQQFRTLQLQRHQRQRIALSTVAFMAMSTDTNKTTRRRGPRQAAERSERMQRDPTTGNFVPFAPTDTQWYFMYILNPNIGSPKFQKLFRNRFRMSYSCFQTHLQELSDDATFRQWSTSSKDAAGKDSAPLGLLLLGALRYLGRAWTFDDLEEQTAISAEIHRSFYHVYTQWCSTTLYKKYVTYPTLDEAKEYSRDYELAGFPGCIGSGDGTHVMMHRCPWKLIHYHKSYKLGQPARNYNVFVNHRRLIMACTNGHPAKWNDMTTVKYDKFAQLIAEGKLFGDDEEDDEEDVDDFFFQLKEKKADGSISFVWYRGCYTIVDNGYLDWSTTIPPMKSYDTYAEMRWSKWLESMRKDVECVFGILKGRFTVLKKGITLHGIDACDKTFLTCCALHNIILLHDEADQDSSTPELPQQGPTQSNTNESAQERRTPSNNDLPLSLRPFADENGVIFVHKLDQHYFRNKLIHHHSIQHEQNLLKWPNGNGLTPPENIVEHS